MSLALTGGKHVSSYMRRGKRVKGYSRKSHNKKKSKSRSRSRSRSRHGGAVPAQAPAYADYFQDYAQVGGYAPSYYDNYVADPRIAGAAGAYDMYYDAVADPRYGGAMAPLAPVDPYADWTQARYAGADGFVDYGMQAPLIAGDSDSLMGGKTGRKSFMRAKPGKKSKTVHVKAVHHVKGQKKGSRSKSKSKSKHGGLTNMPAFAEPLVGGYGGYDAYAPLVGGAYADPYAPMIGGYAYEPSALVGGFDVDASLTGGAKRKKNVHYKHKSYMRAKPGKKSKTVHVKAKTTSTSSKGKKKRGSKSRSRSRSRSRK
jgi:hypothetical protein